MSLGADLRTFLLTSAELVGKVGKRVHQDDVPELTPTTRDGFVFFAVESTERLTLMDDERGEEPHSQTFAVECVALNQSKADAIAEIVSRHLHLYSGAFGARTVQRCFVDDQNDDYTPVANGSDLGVFVRALRVQVFN